MVAGRVAGVAEVDDLPDLGQSQAGSTTAVDEVQPETASCP